MSVWKKLVRTYIVVSLIVSVLAVVKFYPLLTKGEVPPGVSAALNNPAEIENILAHSPINTPAAYIGLGFLYEQKNQPEEAERMYKKAISLEPDKPDAWFKLGVLYQQQSKWTEAADAFEHCLRIKPDFAQAHNNLAITYDALERREDAFKEYAEAARLEPDNAVLRENFELAKQDQGGSIPTQIQVVTPAAEMKIDVAAPIEDQPYFLRSPKRIVLKNGRSLTGDVVDKDNHGLWLETGRGMRLHLSRDEVERIEDAKTDTAGL